MSALTSRLLRLLSMAVMLVATRSLVATRHDRAATRRRPAAVPAPPGADLRPAAAAGTAGPAAPPARTLPAPSARPARPARPGLGTWIGARRLDLCIMGALALGLAAVHAWGMGRYPAFFDDEGTYVSQAWAVEHGQGLAPYVYWYDHPPLGWITLGWWAEVVPMFGPDLHAIAAARAFMVLTFVASACLLYVIARRLGLRRPFAAGAVLLFGLSPLAVHYQRMVLLDNIALPWLLGALALALGARRRLWAYAGAGACLAGACLTKETFLLFAPAVLLAVWQRAEGPTRRFALAVFAALSALVLAFYPLFALLRGELFAGADHTSLVDGIRFQLAREGSGSLLDPDSGARVLIGDWLALDPVVLALGLVALPAGLWLRRLRPVAIALLVPLLMAARPGAYLPAMYVIGLLPFAALLAAGVAQWLWRPRAARAAVLAALLAVVVLAAPRWSDGLASATGDDPNRPYRDAVAWLEANADREATVLVDNTVWTDLVERGFRQERVVWFYKLDLDPAVRVPWQRFDYVVRTDIISGLAERLPRTGEVLARSVPVAAFTSGGETVEIRRVVAAGGPPAP